MRLKYEWIFKACQRLRYYNIRLQTAKQFKQLQNCLTPTYTYQLIKITESIISFHSYHILIKGFGVGNTVNSATHWSYVSDRESCSHNWSKYSGTSFCSNKFVVSCSTITQCLCSQGQVKGKPQDSFCGCPTGLELKLLTYPQTSTTLLLISGTQTRKKEQNQLHSFIPLITRLVCNIYFCTIRIFEVTTFKKIP